MSSALRIAGTAVVGIIALWLLLQVVGVIVSFVGWVIGMAVSLLVLAAVVYVGYVLVTNVLT